MKQNNDDFIAAEKRFLIISWLGIVAAFAVIGMSIWKLA